MTAPFVLDRDSELAENWSLDRFFCEDDVAPTEKAFENLSDRVGAVDNRLSRLEGSLGTLKWIVIIFAAVVVSGVGSWGWWMSSNVIAMRQRIADGGTHEIVSGLQKASTPQAMAANMTLLKGQVELATSQRKAPDLPKIRVLASQVDRSIERFPDVPQSWSAAATLVSYSTDVGPLSAELPDCETGGLKPRWIDQKDVPEIPFQHGAESLGYIFRNCRLKLSTLPGPGISGRLSDAPQPPPYIPGEKYRLGVPAYAVNVTLVLDDQGISDTNILSIFAVRCKYDFSVSQTPKLNSTRLLRAALQSKTPGTAQLPV